MSTWEEFHCPRCDQTFEIRIDLSFDRRMVAICPHCGHEQAVEIKDGRRLPVAQS
jgi:putative FmdB family regulatory protein